MTAFHSSEVTSVPTRCNFVIAYLARVNVAILLSITQCFKVICLVKTEHHRESRVVQCVYRTGYITSDRNHMGHSSLSDGMAALLGFTCAEYHELERIATLAE